MRTCALLVLSTASILLAPPAARADGPAPVPGAPPAAVPVPVPPMGTFEQAKDALEKFKQEFKGNDPDAKIAALGTLSKTQQASVVLEIAKHVTNKNADVRTMAAVFLGDQRASPGLAGQKVIASFEPNTSDAIYLMKAVDSATSLEYRGSLAALLKLLKHKNGAVVKAALVTLGDMKDMRAIDTLVEMLKGTKIDAGSSWEGGEVHVDTGASGDADQKAAEAQYQDKYGAKGVGKSGGGKKFRDIGEVLLLVLKDITGQQFTKSDQAKAWIAANKAEIDAKKKALDDVWKKQDADAAAQLDALKTAK